MFPFNFDRYCEFGGEPLSRKDRLGRRLKFLKRMRDELETRLAGVSAAITTIERQLSEEDVA
ncbi:MAG: hypothetical protein H7Y22_14220 [Gemmatimonadaceae bacterium]|nr:hypothetical protein [Gloeobacterales cyanobacterium ES-bin-141]